MKQESRAYNRARKTIRIWIVLFMTALIMSGLTALGIETQMVLFSGWFPAPDSAVGALLWKAFEAIVYINKQYPFLSYGYDWLAFAHIVIAVVFIGPLKDPIKNKWVIEFGLIACALVVPFALLAGALRGLPLWWRLIDCSFGIIGSIPLFICYRLIKKVEKLEIEKASFRNSRLQNV